MFKLEKVFQNDDSGYYFFINLIKSLTILGSIYVFSILEKNSIYELLNYKIFLNSKYFLYSFLISILYFFISFNFKKKEYKKNFISFLKEDILNITISHVILFFLFFILNINFEININILYLCVYLTSIFIILKLYFNNLYNRLIEKNIIQKNIMLVGTYSEIKKILNEKFDKIIVFKCCLIIDYKNLDLRYIRSEFKFPIFNEGDDIRSILEYHSLGQIWILNGNNKIKEKSFSKIIQYSVDTLNVSLETNVNLKGKKLLGNKFDYDF